MARRVFDSVFTKHPNPAIAHEVCVVLAQHKSSRKFSAYSSLVGKDCHESNRKMKDTEHRVMTLGLRLSFEQAILYFPSLRAEQYRA